VGGAEGLGVSSLRTQGSDALRKGERTAVELKSLDGTIRNIRGPMKKPRKPKTYKKRVYRSMTMNEARAMTAAQREAEVKRLEKRCAEIMQIAENNNQSTQPWETNASPLAEEFWKAVQRRIAIQSAKTRTKNEEGYITSCL